MTNGEIIIKLNKGDLALIAGSITALKGIVYAGAKMYQEQNKSPEEFISSLREIGISEVIAGALLADRDREIAEKFTAALSAPDIPEDLREYQ